MAHDFQENFWGGDKMNGFDILYQNLKCGSTSAKELSDFIKARSVIEDYNLNLLLKLSRKTNHQFGTFQPLWLILKNSTEKLSSLHAQTLQRFNILVKEINKYCDEHYKKQKQIKTDENPTLEAINELRDTAAQMNKAKEFLNARIAEQEKLLKENASSKELEKAEARTKKAETEFKNLREKCRKLKEDYESKFRVTCANFEKIETEHLKQMKIFLASYAQILQSGHALIGQVLNEFQSMCDDMTVEKLLEFFVKSKGTGSAVSADIQLDDVTLNNLSSTPVNFSGRETLSVSTNNTNQNQNHFDLINLSTPSPVPPPSQTSGTGYSASSTNTTPNLFGDFDFSTLSSQTQSSQSQLSNTNDFAKFDEMSTSSNPKSSRDSSSKLEGFSRTRKSSKKSTADSDNLSVKTDFSQPMVDAEGFTIRPPQAPVDEKENDSFSSDSESDSDDEDKKKIFVRINPLKQGQEKISASVDQLIASAGALTLAPPSSRRNNRSSNPSPVPIQDPNYKRSASATTSVLLNSSSKDLLELFSIPPPGSKPQTQPDLKEEPPKIIDPPTSTTDRYSDLSNILKKLEQVKNETKEDDSDRPPPLPTSSPPHEDEEQKTFVPPLPPKNSEATLSFSTAFSGGGTLSKSFSSSTMTMSSQGVPMSLYGKNATLSKSFVGNGMSRADSVSSLSSDFRMTPIDFSSRDVSPLTINPLEAIPIAISFQESIGGSFKGADESLCRMNVIGCIKIAFSANIVQQFTPGVTLPTLSFSLRNISRIDRIILSKELVSQIETTSEFNRYELNMMNLQANLTKLASQSPNARYYNLDLFKYQLKARPGAINAPLQMASHWKCEPNSTGLVIDFKYNPEAFGLTPQSLKNVQITANLDGDVTNMQSQPDGKWDNMTKQAIWRFAEISSVAPNGTGIGTIKAKFDITNGPSVPVSVYASFNNQDATISGLEFELQPQSGYRLSLVKKQFISGRYYCEPKL